MSSYQTDNRGGATYKTCNHGNPLNASLAMDEIWFADRALTKKKGMVLFQSTQ